MSKIVFWLILFSLWVSSVSAQTVTYKFVLTWDVYPGNEAGFNIYRDGKQIGQAPKDAITYSESVTGAPKQNVCYEITAYGTSWESGKSKQACKAIPDAPTILVSHKFTMSWQDNSTNEQGFKIYRDGKEIGKVGKDVRLYSETVTGPAKQQYCWEVTAYAASESAKSNKSCMALPDAMPPAPASELTTS